MFSNQMVAAEILTTGWCPFNCKYCYIPKTSYMKKLHENIVDDLKSGEYFNRIDAIYGKELTNLGFWGTEPTLTFPIIQDIIPDIVKRYPKLKDISFSSAMMTDPKISRDFLEAVAPYDINIGYQISLDGPSWITDKNRNEGASELIPDNLFKLINLINPIKFKSGVKFRWKATIGINNMEDMVDEPEKINEYFNFFNSLNDTFDVVNKNNKVTLMKGSEIPTLVVPSKYTSTDGKIFAEWLKLMHQKNYQTTYVPRLSRMFKYENELYKRRMFSCSGGDSNFGLGKNLHLCHRTFYLDNEEYLNSVMEEKDIDNWDVSLFEAGSIKYLNRNFIVDPYCKPELYRFLYTMRGYHDFWSLQLSYIRMMLYELAIAGQADPIYIKNDNLALLFALFQNVAMSCPMENVLNTGSIHLQVVSLIRLFSNGAFQEILKEYIRRNKR
jgi:sulfatase maturation enzyme AslB (radical SAM superfamily)